MQNLKLPIALLFFSLATQLTSKAQPNNDIVGTTKFYDTVQLKISRHHSTAESNLNVRSYIIPGLMIAYGFFAIENAGLKQVDKYLQHEVYAERPHHAFKIDDYLQFAPGVLTFGLDVAGIKAKHNVKERTILVLLSNIISNVTTSTIKKHSHQLRPGSAYYGSFPSAHTSYAFANAEFLRQEYKDVSPWYGVVGYTMAMGTAYLRMYNNKHWLSDVIAGAGVGIVSTKLVYWFYPRLQDLIFKNRFPATVVMPTYSNGTVGITLVHKF